jgi:hypothetical protein
MLIPLRVFRVSAVRFGCGSAALCSLRFAWFSASLRGKGSRAYFEHPKKTKIMLARGIWF